MSLNHLSQKWGPVDGTRILEDLDRLHFPVEPMFWVRKPEQDYWRLVIGSKIVAAEGGRAAYHRLDQALESLDLAGVRLDDIALLNPDSPQFSSFYSIASSSSRLAASNGLLKLEDAVVYRWNGESIVGNLTCDISSAELSRLWDVERVTSNQPALLITLEERCLTLRFHPRNGPRENIAGIKQPFQMALHRAQPKCDIIWAS